MESVKISVIVPSYNQGPYIENCIKSVLGQTYANYELIIADGASKDNTIELCEGYAITNPRIKFFSEPDKGFADAVNKALLIAQGNLCIIQSSDDFFSSSKVFENAVKLYNEHPEAVLITGQAVLVDAKMTELLREKREVEDGYVPPENLLRVSYSCEQGSTFFKRERALAVGMLRQKFDIVADTDFWIRMAAYKPSNNKMVYVTNQTWSCVTVQPEQRSSDRSKFVLATSKLLHDFWQDDQFSVPSNIRQEAAEFNIKYGIMFFACLGKSFNEQAFILQKVTGRTFTFNQQIKYYLARYSYFRKKYFNNFEPNNSLVHLLKLSRGQSYNWFNS